MSVGLAVRRDSLTATYTSRSQIVLVVSCLYRLTLRSRTVFSRLLVQSLTKAQACGPSQSIKVQIMIFAVLVLRSR